MTARQRRARARKAADARWGKLGQRKVLISLVREALKPVAIANPKPRTGDELMAYRNYWRDQKEMGHITQRQYSSKIRRACKDLCLHLQATAPTIRDATSERQR